jgi:hypothetical protein
LTSGISGLARRHLKGKAGGGTGEKDAPDAGKGGENEEKLPTFAVQYEHRSSSHLDRLAVINALVDGVPPGHTVNLSTPDITILASAVRGQVSLGVVPGYARLHKLNLRELACPSPEAAKAREEREAKARAREQAGEKEVGEEEKEVEEEEKVEEEKAAVAVAGGQG